MAFIEPMHRNKPNITYLPALNLYQTGSFENKCDERFISCDSDVNSISSEPCRTALSQ